MFFFQKTMLLFTKIIKKRAIKQKIVIATGSSVASLPGIEIDEKNIISSTGRYL